MISKKTERKVKNFRHRYLLLDKLIDSNLRDTKFESTKNWTCFKVLDLAHHYQK